MLNMYNSLLVLKDDVVVGWLPVEVIVYKYYVK